MGQEKEMEECLDQEAMVLQNELNVEASGSKEKCNALREAEDVRIHAEANAEQASDLHSELCSIKDLLRAANDFWTDSKKSADSNLGMESLKVDHSSSQVNLSFHQEMLEVQNSRDFDAKLIEETSLARKLEQELGAKEGSKMRIEMLEKELDNAKASEGKMLESLASQTKQFEETKISLEEAKLEIAILHEKIAGVSRSDAPPGSHRCSKMVEQGQTIKKLENELKSATQAEEKIRAAMDGLALALKEVVEEAKQAKEKLALAQSKLEITSMDAEQLVPVAKGKEGKLQELLDDTRREAYSYKMHVERLKKEAEESTISWDARERGLLNHIEMSEAEIASLKGENRRLVDLLMEAEDEAKKAGEEIRNLRDIIKQAVKEATAAKEAAEIARSENSQLRDSLSQISCSKFESITKEDGLISTQENCLNGTKAASSPCKTSSSSAATVVNAEPENNREPVRVTWDVKDRREIEESTFEHAKENSLDQLKNAHRTENEITAEGSMLDPVSSLENGSTSEMTLATVECDQTLQTGKKAKKSLLTRLRLVLRRKVC